MMWLIESDKSNDISVVVELSTHHMASKLLNKLGVGKKYKSVELEPTIFTEQTTVQVRYYCFLCYTLRCVTGVPIYTQNIF